MKNGKRDYKTEVAKYTSRPEVKKKRAEQNAARREMSRAGLVHKGDGKDVDHKRPLSKGGSTSRSNLRVVPSSSNRSFSRNPDGSLKSQTSRKERK
jgi:5-methylcytosine-specific restriction endonuclease McrA